MVKRVPADIAVTVYKRTRWPIHSEVLEPTGSVSDALLNLDTIGLMAPCFDLVLHLAERPQAITAEPHDDRTAPILKKVADHSA